MPHPPSPLVFPGTGGPAWGHAVWTVQNRGSACSEEAPLAQTPSATGGVFTQRRHSASHYGVYPGNTPCTPPPYRSVRDPFKIASGVQSAGPWAPWLPAVENSRLFAQRTVRPHRSALGMGVGSIAVHAPHPTNPHCLTSWGGRGTMSNCSRRHKQNDSKHWWRVP